MYNTKIHVTLTGKQIVHNIIATRIRFREEYIYITQREDSGTGVSFVLKTKIH